MEKVQVLVVYLAILENLGILRLIMKKMILELRTEIKVIEVLALKLGRSCELI
jgi:hypothetical protein